MFPETKKNRSSIHHPLINPEGINLQYVTRSTRSLKFSFSAVDETLHVGCPIEMLILHVPFLLQDNYSHLS